MRKIPLIFGVGALSISLMAGCSSNQDKTQPQTQKETIVQPSTPKQTKFIEVHIGNSSNTEMINVDHIVWVTRDTLQRTLISVDNSNAAISTDDSYNEVIAEIQGGGK